MRNLGGCRGPWGVSMGEGAKSFCQGVTTVNKAEQYLTLKLAALIFNQLKHSLLKCKLYLNLQFTPHLSLLLPFLPVNRFCHCNIPNRRTHTHTHTNDYPQRPWTRVARFSQQNLPNCYSKLAQSRFEGGSPVKIAFQGVNITLLGSLQPADMKNNPRQQWQFRGKTADLATLDITAIRASLLRRYQQHHWVVGCQVDGTNGLKFVCADCVRRMRFIQYLATGQPWNMF